jgi:hypothetical protein
MKRNKTDVTFDAIEVIVLSAFALLACLLLFVAASQTLISIGLATETAISNLLHASTGYAYGSHAIDWIALGLAMALGAFMSHLGRNN